MKTKTFNFILFVFLWLFLSFNLQAQNPNFEGELSKIVTEESRQGWIQIQPSVNIDNVTFLNLLNENAGPTGRSSFHLKKEETSKIGTKRYIYQQEYLNIPVEGYYWLLHERQSRIFLAQGTSLPAAANENTTPSYSETQGLDFILNAKDTLNFKEYAWEDNALEEILQQVKGDPNATHYPKGELVWIREDLSNLLVLTYKYEVYTVQPLSRKHYYVDAHTGRIVKTIDLLTTGCFEENNDHAGHSHQAKDQQQICQQQSTTTTKPSSKAAASGKANYVKLNDGVVNFSTDLTNNLYHLHAKDLGAGSQVVKTLSANNRSNYNTLTDFTDSDNYWDQDTIAIGAHWGTEEVYDYFLSKHGRNSFDGNGSDLLSIVHYGTNYANAFWNGVSMTYGDGNGTSWSALTSFDVLAHEIAHGVTENNGTGGLIYYYESGALNESFSDIFGVVFEFQRHPDGGDWMMGEDFDLIDHDGFRNMQNPSLKGHAKTYHGTLWYDGLADNRGVHWNSGVQNYWFYLLSTGGSGTNEYLYDFNVTGIGLDNAASIAYRNLTTYLTPNATFGDAMNGAIQSAIDLFGEGSQQHQSTVEAWCAVGVGTTCLPQIELLKPTENLTLISGTDYTITWTSTLTESLKEVTIEYTNQVSTNANWTAIATVPNTGTYDWFVPNEPSNTMRIRITDAGDNSVPRSANPLIRAESDPFIITSCAGLNSFTVHGTVSLNALVTFEGNVIGDSYEWLVNNEIITTTKNMSYLFNEYGVSEIVYKIYNTASNCVNIESTSYRIIPDNVCDARPIEMNLSYEETFTAATVEQNEPLPPGGNCTNQDAWCGTPLYGSVWYSITPTADATVRIQTKGITSLSDTKIALYESIDCNQSNPFQNAILLAANDDDFITGWDGSTIQRVCVKQGTTYYLQVDQWNPNQTDFTLIVEEVSILGPVLEEDFTTFDNLTTWVFNRGANKFMGRVNAEPCPRKSFSVQGQTFTKNISSIDLPLIDFTQNAPNLLIFDYAHIPQNSTVVNELRIEVGDACGNFTPLHNISAADLSTNDQKAHSEGFYYIPACEEFKSVQLDLSHLEGTAEVAIRIVADGPFKNPILFDDLFLGSTNDTCRMQDSLVLVDIYNATAGANWTNPWNLNEPLENWYGVTINRFGCVTSLDLDGNLDCLTCFDYNNSNNVTGTLPNSIWNLKELEHLSLNNNPTLEGTISANVNQLSKLQTLTAYYNKLGGAIPNEIGDLSALTYLRLDRNELTGTLPSSLGNLSNLTSLSIEDNQLTGSIPSSIGNLSKLVYLNVSDNQLAGNIPPELGDLSRLYLLDLGDNDFSGAVPASFTNLISLNFLYLNHNALSSLPDLSSLTDLYYLSLSRNPIGGTIPLWISNLKKMNTLNLDHNEWTGTIPESFGDLSLLSILDLSNNELTGNIPEGLSNTLLYHCDLSNNQLEGAIPTSFGSLGTLEILSLSDNNLSGILPDFSVANKLRHLSISNNQFTFEDLLPHFSATSNTVNTNSNTTSDYQYAPQQMVYETTNISGVEGANVNIDLYIDNLVTTNTYKWLKDNEAYTNIIGDNTLAFNNLSFDHIGVYSCEITNSNIPDLSLFSRQITIDVTTLAITCDDMDMDVDRSTSGQMYHAINSIKSSTEITNNSTITFRAGNYILLQPGFSVESGSEFKAQIISCEDPFVERDSVRLQYNKKQLDPLSVRPNPFSNTTSISYELEQDQEIELGVYDLTGHLLKQLVPYQQQSAGYYKYSFSSPSLKTGMYIVLLRMDEKIYSQKIIQLE